MAGWRAHVVRIAVLMLVVYAGVLAFGLNEFRKTPQSASSRSSTAAILIIVVAIAARRLARAHRRGQSKRAVEHRAATSRASRTRVNIVGFSGATFTNAPNAGAIFVVLDAVREARGRSEPVGGGDPGRSCSASWPRSRRLHRCRCSRRRCAASAMPAASA